MADQWAKRAPWTGIVAIVMFVVAFIISGETPDFDASTRDILDFYNGDQTNQVIASILLLYGSILLVFFAAALRSALRGAEALSLLVLIGGTLLASGLVIFAGLNFTLADLANSDHLDRIAPGTLQSLNALNSDFFFPVAAGLGTLMLATALSSLRSKALPAWLAWPALVLGIAALTPVGFFAFLLFGVWTLVTSVVLWRSFAAATPAAPSAP